MSPHFDRGYGSNTLTLYMIDRRTKLRHHDCPRRCLHDKNSHPDPSDGEMKNGMRKTIDKSRKSPQVSRLNRQSPERGQIDDILKTDTIFLKASRLTRGLRNIFFR